MRVTLNIKLPRRRGSMEARKPLIWRWDTGHYGGYFVDVPLENFTAFKARFPRGVFPRKVVEKNVTDMGIDAIFRYDSMFPRSRGRYYQVYFGNRTVGERILTEGRMLQDETAEIPQYD